MTSPMSDERPPAAARPAPRVSVGLPVYNGERFLREALEALLDQTFTDLELIVSDNASTDSTRSICEEFAARDPRVRYVRQPVNIGSAANHNAVIHLSRGEYFKWASDDDLYAPEFIERCVAVLDANPDVVVCHSRDAFIDEAGHTVQNLDYHHDTEDPRAWIRLRCLLHESGGNDIYGLVRRSLLGTDIVCGSYHNADRTFVAALSLHGRFHHVPEVLYFRRDHPGRTEREGGDHRRRAAILHPSRGSRWRNPMVRLYVEYIGGYFLAVARAPLSLSERMRCYREVIAWLVGRVRPGRDEWLLSHSPDPAVQARALRSIEARKGRLARLLPRSRAT